MSVSKNTPRASLGRSRKLEEEPRIQPYYHHDGSSWVSSSASLPRIDPSETINPTSLRLLSWNIDMQLDFAAERMSAALEYLSTVIATTPSEVAVAVFLQEMSRSDMRQIRDTSWIQRCFYIADVDEGNWASRSYGTQTLIDRRLTIENIFRVQWISGQGHDGLFVDVALAADGKGKVLRLCNTHLESLVANPPVRPRQFKAAAPYLHDTAVSASILAGDLNAIQPFDRTLHSENNLRDVYLELGGQEYSDEGYTWGYQVPQAIRARFGCSRMDKILFAGALLPRRFQRIGVGIRVAEEEREEMRDSGQEEWVTDHYGVMADLELSGGCEWAIGGAGKATVRSNIT